MGDKEKSKSYERRPSTNPVSLAASEALYRTKKTLKLSVSVLTHNVASPHNPKRAQIVPNGELVMVKAFSTGYLNFSKLAIRDICKCCACTKALKPEDIKIARKEALFSIYFIDREARRRKHLRVRPDLWG